MNIFLKKERSKSCIRNDTRNLRVELLSLLHKKFNFCAKLRINELKQTHLLKKIRRDIARIKFYLSRNC